jgi:hypothetical protein
MNTNWDRYPNSVILSEAKDPSRWRAFVLPLGSFALLRMTVAGVRQGFVSLRVHCFAIFAQPPSWYPRFVFSRIRAHPCHPWLKRFDNFA